MLFGNLRTATANHSMGKMSHGHINISFMNKIVGKLFWYRYLRQNFKISCQTDVFYLKKRFFDCFLKTKILSSFWMFFGDFSSQKHQF